MPAATKEKPAATKAAAKKKSTPIAAYNPPVREVQKYNDLPFEFGELYEALDDITLAAEGGKLTDENWVCEIFAATKDFEAFLDDLSTYDELFRIHDRWWYALAALANTGDEEYFARCEDIAHRLRERAVETGQL